MSKRCVRRSGFEKALFHPRGANHLRRFALSAGFGTMELDKGTQENVSNRPYQRPKRKMEEKEPL